MARKRTPAAVAEIDPVERLARARADATGLDAVAAELEDAVHQAVGHGPVAALLLERRHAVELAQRLRICRASLRSTLA